MLAKSRAKAGTNGSLRRLVNAENMSTGVRLVAAHATGRQRLPILEGT